MPSFTVYANAFSGNMSNPDNAIGAPDGIFTTDTSGNAWQDTFFFETPPDLEISGTQTIRFWLRKSNSGGAAATFDLVRINSDGVQVGAFTPSATSITSYPAAQQVTVTFDGAILTGALSVTISSPSSGGKPTDRRNVQVDAIAWEGFGNVTIPNVPPVAVAGEDDSVKVGATYTLDGSGSYDTDGSIVSYNWSITSGPGSLNNSTSPVATFSASAAGTTVVRLTVTDNDGATATDDITITSVANQTPVADAGADQTVLVGTEVTLDGSASYDPDGSITYCLWSQASGPTVTIANPNSLVATFTPSEAGTYLFSLTVTDDSTAYEIDTVTITVEPPPSTYGWSVIIDGEEVDLTFAGRVQGGVLVPGELFYHIVG